MRSLAAWTAGGFAALALASAAGAGAPGSAESAVSASESASVPADAADHRARDDALRRYFMSDDDWLRRGVGGPSFGGRVYCGLSVLGSSPDQSRLYLWVHCQEYYAAEGAEVGEARGPAVGGVAEGTGVSAPVLAVVSGRGAVTVVQTWRMPADGAAYAPTLRAMFPEELLEEALAGDSEVVPAPEELRARAVRALAG